MKNLPAKQETQIPSLGSEDPLEKKRATRSSILAWRILWTEEPGGPRGVAKNQTRLSNKHAHTSFRPNVCSLAYLIKDA